MPNEITEEQLDELIAENYNLRRLLWIYHGHKEFLRGDGRLIWGDGEMQCAKCVLDFKRDHINVIRRRLSGVI